jgi:omega-6 fatty acid desaturase (delta-12 desaturase)
MTASTTGDSALLRMPERPADEALSYGALLTQFPADNRMAARQLAVTALSFVVLWTMCAKALSSGVSIAYTLPLQIIAAGLLVRLFMLQHDCGHGSFFEQRWLNDLVGRSIGVLTLTPYDQWRSGHAFHHANNGNLDQRGVGDIHFLTVEEYRRLSRWRRWGYRLYRNPWIFFGIGPVYLFVLKHRIPVRGPDGRRRFNSVMATNIAALVTLAVLDAMVGTQTLLLTQLPITYLASVFGVWIFYVQHQFDGVQYTRRPDWKFRDGALLGSSLYVLPPVLNWFTADIGIHHLHHLCSKIPNYRLQACLKRFPQLAKVGRLGLWESFGTIWLVLWDEHERRLISFQELASDRYDSKLQVP